MQKENSFSFHFRVQSKFGETKITKSFGNILILCRLKNMKNDKIGCMLKINPEKHLGNMFFSRNFAEVIFLFITNQTNT